MYNIGEILKYNFGTTTNQTFLMYVGNDSIVILFDNKNNNTCGDTTKGINLNEYTLSSIQELSKFIVDNNL